MITECLEVSSGETIAPFPILTEHRAPSPLSFLVQPAVSCAAQAQVCDTLEVVARLLWGDSGAARQCHSRDLTQNLATLVDAEKLHGAGEFLCRLEPDIP